MQSTLEIGRIYFSGSTCSPTRSKPLAIIDWDDLPERVRVAQAPHTARVYQRQSGAQWVRFARFGGVGCYAYLPLDVFLATYYESVDAMIAAYRR